MGYSNSSLNCFASCMAKYEHNYILHTPPCRPQSPHLAFGTMAHECLHKAGTLRDNAEDGVILPGEYHSIIPSEVLYPELKQEFQIRSWLDYFLPVIKQTAKYEKELIQELRSNCNGCEVSVERELKIQLTVDEVKDMLNVDLDQPLVGVIDLLLISAKSAYIIDYKFSTNQKTQDNFDMDSQLPLYAMLVHLKYDIPLHEIKYGYIDIPKKAFDKPTILTNGTLSRAKEQNVSQDLYARAVEAIHGNDPKYNCKEGGYYYDAWCNMALNKPAYISMQWLDINVYQGIITDLLDAAVMIKRMKEFSMKFLKKYDSYSCKSCEFIDACKPWLTVEAK